MQVSFASGSTSTINGVVTDAYTNALIPLAKVDVGTGSSWFERSLGSTTTDANGRYSIQVPMSDQYQFLVHPKEIERDQYRFYDHCWSRRTVQYGSTIQVDFALEPCGSILVKMFDPDGRALGERSWQNSWVNDLQLATMSGDATDNRTHGHAQQPYRTDDEEVMLLSPEGAPMVVSTEIVVPSFGRLRETIDNGGLGFSMRRGDLLVLNLNYEVVRAVYKEFSATFGSLWNKSPLLNDSVPEISKNLADAQTYELQRQDARCATESNAALLKILGLRDKMWQEIPFKADHPRLMFSRTDLEAIKKKVGSGFPQQTWKSILADCNKFLTLPPPQLVNSPAYKYGDWIAAGDKAVMRMEYLSLAYLITEDAKYAAKAKEIMWAVFSWVSWIDPAEKAEHGDAPALMAGRITAGVAITYDWLFDYLTGEERAFVQRTLGEKGAEPLYQASIGGVWWSDRSHCNQNAITHAGMGLAGLAFLSEHPNASKWIGLASSKIWKYFDSGGRNGGWGEGFNYWKYGLVHAVLFTDALRRVTGVDLYQSAFLKETLYFPIYLSTPGLQGFVNFGDSWGLAYADTAALTLRLSSEYRNGQGQAFFNLLSGKLPLEEDENNPWALIWYDDSVKTDPLDDLPLSRLFEGLGWVIVRGGWGPQDVLLAFKSGPNWGHGHADQNNFILEAFGEPLIVDLGPAFYSLEYTEGPIDYHMASVGHNVILIDGIGQVDPRRGWQESGRILSFRTFAGQESYEYIAGDASAAYPMSVKFIRQMMFVQNRFLIILDTVEAPKSSRFQWLAHTTGDFATEEDEFRITKGKAALIVKFLLPDNFDSHVYHDQRRTIFWSKDEPASRLEVSTQEPSLSATFLTVLYPVKSNEVAPRISLIENATTWTVNVEDTRVHHLIFNRTATFIATTTTTTLLPTSSSLSMLTTATAQTESQPSMMMQGGIGFQYLLAVVVVAILAVAVLGWTRYRRKPH
jgi:hypothetical protein